MNKQVILIMVDTQRKDMLGCYRNDEEIKTPNIDYLASKGMKFDNCYCAQPVCGPARSAIFTGLYPHSNASWGNSMALSSDVKTIGQRLAQNDIATAYIGKYHLDGGDYFGYGICPDGWDKEYWYDMRCYLEELTDQERLASRDYETCLKDDFDESLTYANRCAKRAIEYIEKNKDNHYFLTLSFDEPHEPSLCPKPFNKMYENYEFNKSQNVCDDLNGKPEHQKVWSGDYSEQNRNEIKIMPYELLGCNSYVDYEIGKVIKAIENYAPDALVLYTSDHGTSLQSHSISGKGPAMYEEITNVPFIVSQKGNITYGTTSNELVSHIDITPTILDFFNINKSRMLQGKSLLPVFENKQKINNEIFIEFNRYEVDHDGFGGFMPIRCVFDGRYKLVINLLSSDELYDLLNDKDEMFNLIEEPKYIVIRNNLLQKLISWMNETRDPFRGYVWSKRSWNKDFVCTWDYTGYTRQNEDEQMPTQLDYNTGLVIDKAVRKK